MLAWLLYGAMAAVGFGWLWATDRLHLLRADPNSWLGRIGMAEDLLGNLGTGMLLALAVVVFTHLVLQRLPGAEFLEKQFQGALAGLQPRQALLLALSSGIGEELLFRGLLQTWLSDHSGPVIGVLLASAVFAAAHAGHDRRFLLWTLFAFATGSVLGVLYHCTGSLQAPIALHATVNGTQLLVESWEQRVRRSRTGPQRISTISPR